MDLSYDSKFQKCKNLYWLPYVGEGYSSLDRKNKVLVIGESHYHDNTPRSIKDHQLKEFTRIVVAEQAISRNYVDTKMFSNFHRTLMGNDDFNSTQLWGKLSFYNFVQRPMSTNKERPVKSDFLYGWDSFIDVIKILEPGICIFIGVEASNTLGQASKNSELTLNSFSWGTKINGTYSRRASVRILSGPETELLFIRHTSQYFSWELWKQHLDMHIPGTLNYLKR